jgi:hypothetical protein
MHEKACEVINLNASKQFDQQLPVGSLTNGLDDFRDFILGQGFEDRLKDRTRQLDRMNGCHG